MKILLASASLLALLSVPAFAADIAAVNASLDKTLRSLGDNQTAVTLVLDEVKADATRTNHVKAHGTYRKGQGLVTVDSMVYDYNNGNPTLHTLARVDADFTHILPAEQWKFLAPNMESILNIGARSWAHDFGNAVTYKVRVTKLAKDQTGTYSSFHVDANFSVNLKNLPANVKASDVESLSGLISADVELAKGMKLDVTVRPNIEASNFGANEKSLPELLDKIAAGDAGALAEVGTLYKYIDARLGLLAVGQLPSN